MPHLTAQPTPATATESPANATYASSRPEASGRLGAGRSSDGHSGDAASPDPLQDVAFGNNNPHDIDEDPEIDPVEESDEGAYGEPCHEPDNELEAKSDHEYRPTPADNNVKWSACRAQEQADADADCEIL